jgi:hypothetical protein
MQAYHVASATILIFVTASVNPDQTKPVNISIEQNQSKFAARFHHSRTKLLLSLLLFLLFISILGNFDGSG